MIDIIRFHFLLDLIYGRLFNSKQFILLFVSSRLCASRPCAPRTPQIVMAKKKCWFSHWAIGNIGMISF